MAPYEAPPGFSWVFCKSFRHYRTGKQVYRKNGGYFCFLVETFGQLRQHLLLRTHDGVLVGKLLSRFKITQNITHIFIQFCIADLAERPNN